MVESKLTKTGYELESVHIIQSPISYIEHRGECDPMIEMCGRKVYPVIVSPMGAVTNEDNYKVWLENNFICVVPRTVDFEKRLEISKETYVSVSLAEAEQLLDPIKNLFKIEYSSTLNLNGVCTYKPILENMEKRYICIDIAHGTMQKLYCICSEFKAIFNGKVEIMTGNVANPQAYSFYAANYISYGRFCIGTGSRCVVKGTRIKMADGTYLPIENIDKGDYVETINGSQRVLNTFSKQTKNTILINGNIETTSNHKFFVLKKEDFSANISDEEIKTKGFYLEADKLSDKYLLVQE